MRIGQLVFHSQRDAPSDAEAISHQLLVRASFIRRLTSGVYSYLPLGMRTLSKIGRIVREEFDLAGAQEILLPSLHPVEIWEQSGRLSTMEDVLMGVETKGGRFVLGPTHEEAVIQAISPELASYRDLPVTVYQLQTKFRDEARPRFGLLRTKEFIMADAYSFDLDQDSMRESYAKIFHAYLRIFSRLGIPVTPVEADSGSIGGDVNHEFMVVSAIGEDRFALCVSCGYAANIEAAVSGTYPQVDVVESLPAAKEIATPASTSIVAVVATLGELGLGVDPSRVIKSMLCVDDEGNLTLACIPGNRELRLPGSLKLAREEDFERVGGLVRGYLGPQGMQDLGIKVIADPVFEQGGSWVGGANRGGFHTVGLVAGRDFAVDSYQPITTVQDGDPCPTCGETIELVRSVEAGHMFQLGLTYSNKIASATYVDEQGGSRPYWMGCYGIGVTRLLAVIAEYLADERGMRWPVNIAPFEVILISIGADRNQEVAHVSEQIYGELRALGIDLLFDDREVSAGVKLADAELVGIPFSIVVGQKSLRSGNVELRQRMDSSVLEVPVSEVTSLVREKVGAQRST